MNDTADLVGVLRAAGETTRLRLLALLADGEQSVKDLTEILGQSQPRVSRHLKLLADAGLVHPQRRGRLGLLLALRRYWGRGRPGALADRPAVA
jgi:DNA-binding transcriptional ArsR family regulator